MNKFFLLIIFLSINQTSYLMKSEMEIDYEENQNSINFAINVKNTDLLKKLLIQGINPNIHSNTVIQHSLYLPICNAASCSNVEALKVLLDYKTCPNLINNHEGPLIHAIRSKSYDNKYEVCKLLLQSGANPNEITYQIGIAQTPLTEAIHIVFLQKRKEEKMKSFFYKQKVMLRIIKLLLLFGADPHLKLKKANIQNITYKFENAIEFAQNCSLEKVYKILNEYQDRRYQIVSLILYHAKPKLPNEIIEMITKEI